MERRSHIGLNRFEKNNWLPVKNRIDQCIEVPAYNFKGNLYIYIYIQNFSPVVKAKKSMDNFVEAIYLKEISRKSISYLRSKTWNGLDGNIKK